MSPSTSAPIRDEFQRSGEALSDEVLQTWRDKLAAKSLKKQLTAIAEVAALGASGWPLLMERAVAIAPTPVSLAAALTDDQLALGAIYYALAAVEDESVQAFLQQNYPQGIAALPAGCKVDYQPVQGCLMAHEFEEGDRQTLKLMCELAGPTAVARNWLYFTEASQFPALDLQALDRLWLIYSAGKFGFSVQQELWLGVQRDWEKFWPKIDWKEGNHWTRYPGEFQWTLDAPKGHLPLTNQLRGVRVMEALMNHPAWD
ncbi:MAG: GUN4 N-terminal ARM-like repeat domain-containing protein [Cyanobacteria bacterium P01_H01_bin.130]